MPAMQQHQQLDFATKTLKMPKPVPYRRIKISSSTLDTVGGDSSETSHLDTNQANVKKLSVEGHDVSETSIIQHTDSANETLNDIPDEDIDIKNTKLISIGSPVPESYKTAKPPLENWSENNSLADLIYFENLPNYTGVFNKMRTVLGSVRSRLFDVEKSSKGSKEGVASEVEALDEVVALDEEESNKETVQVTNEVVTLDDDDDPVVTINDDGED